MEGALPFLESMVVVVAVGLISGLYATSEKFSSKSTIIENVKFLVLSLQPSIFTSAVTSCRNPLITCIVPFMLVKRRRVTDLLLSSTHRISLPFSCSIANSATQFLLAFIIGCLCITSWSRKRWSFVRK